jgi:hypothetical protein
MGMKIKIRAAIGAAGLAALACADSVRAHHSYLTYQTTPFWINGTVTRFELKNPHTVTTLEVESEDGQVREWTVEGPSQTALDRRSGSGEYVPKVGDSLEVCAFPYAPPLDESVARRRLELRIVAGHVLVTPGGAMQAWGHGYIAGCMRSPKDQRQPWLDFLNASPQVHELWCRQRGFPAVQSNESLKELVDQTSALLDEVCE